MTKHMTKLHPTYRFFNFIKTLIVKLTVKKDIRDNILDVRNELNTTNEVDTWFKRNLTYKTDTELWDHWKEPLRTFLDRNGDCEDYALLAAFFLRNKVDKLEILCMFTEDKQGHATCLINGTITLANWGLVQHGTTNPFNIAKYFFKKPSKIIIYKVRFSESGDWLDTDKVSELSHNV